MEITVEVMLVSSTLRRLSWGKFTVVAMVVFALRNRSRRILVITELFAGG